MAVFNLNNLKKNNDQIAWFVLDILMVALAFVNINLIIFDFTFSYNLGSNFYYSIAPNLAAWYDVNIHQNFISIDLIFVAIFSVEFLIRWMVAIYKKEFYKWFFFPFARWYDVLGLIPIGSFRFLRVLRIVSIILRLQKMKVLNLKESSFYPGFKKYTQVLVEEVSDRVVVNVLESVEKELDKGNHFSKEFVAKVLRPNQEQLVNFSLKRVQLITQQILQDHKEDIKLYLNEKVQEAVSSNDEMKLIKSVPGLGGIIRKQLDHAIADITFKVIAGIVEDVSKGEDVFTKEIEVVSNNLIHTLEQDEELEELVKTISNQTISLLKTQVLKQDWKENEAKI